MEPAFALTLENKVNAVRECNLHLKNKGLPPLDADYTHSVKAKYLEEIYALIETHPELLHHPALFKIEADFPKPSPEKTKLESTLLEPSLLGL